jgi:hypothetical protein
VGISGEYGSYWLLLMFSLLAATTIEEEQRTEGESQMPQIIVRTDGPDTNGGTEVHRERVEPADVTTEAASRLLVERIGWALSDAEDLESRDGNVAAPFTRERGSIADASVHAVH